MTEYEQNSIASHCMPLSIGFTVGVLSGILPAYMIFCRNMERDAFGIVLAAATLVVALGIAGIQIALALIARQESDRSLRSIERNLYQALLGTFHEIFDGVHRIICDAASDHQASVDLGWPVHNLGNVNLRTRGTDVHKKVKTALIDMVAAGKNVDLCTVPLIQSRNASWDSPILKLFEVAAAADISDFSKDIAGNLRDEVGFIIDLLSAVEKGPQYRSSGVSPLCLTWVERAPVHWSYSTSQDKLDQGILFTSASPQDKQHLTLPMEARTFILRSCEGMLIQAKAGPLLMRVAQSLREHDSVNVFDTVEPRLLRMLLRHAIGRLDAGNRPNEVLNELGKCMYSAGRLVYWYYVDPTSITSRRAAYVWQKKDTKNVLVVVPSAAGLYALWREDEKSLHEVRFTRYAQLCEHLRESCNCNVILLSQGGQGGYGLWSPSRSVDESRQALASLGRILNGDDVATSTSSSSGAAEYNVAYFGVCTGGLAAMSVFLDCMRSNRPSGAVIKGIAFWDVVANPGFRWSNVEAVRKRYDLHLADQSEFSKNKVTLADKLAKQCVQAYRHDEVKRFWVGGVAQSVRFAAESTRKTHSWVGVKAIGDLFGNSCNVTGFGDIGHVPGGPDEDEYKKFIESIKNWVTPVFRQGKPVPATATPSGGVQSDVIK